MGESAQSWRELLLDLKRRGLSSGPQLAVGDGALGFWKALEEVWLNTRAQTANVLNKLPNSLHAKTKHALYDIWMAEPGKGAETAFDAFIATGGRKYEKGRVPQQGSRRLARFLRLPRRALAALANHKPDRERVCHRSASNDPIQGLPLKQDRARDDLQARASRREDLAPPQRLCPVLKGCALSSEQSSTTESRL